MSAGVTQLITGINGAIRSMLAGSDGTNVVPGHTAFDPNGAPHGVSGNPFITKPVGGTLVYTLSGQASVTTSSSTIVTAGSVANTLSIQNTGSTGNVWINPTGNPAVVGQGYEITPGGSFTFGGAANPVPSGNVTAISDSGTVNVATMGG